MNIKNDWKDWHGKHIPQIPDVDVARYFSRVPLSAHILDFGCGHGITTEFLYESGHNAFGIDINLPINKPRLACLDINLVEDNYYDYVVDLEVLTYCPQNIKEVHRVLNPNGKLFSKMFNRVYSHDVNGDFTSYDENRKELEKYFEIKEIETVTRKSSFLIEEVIFEGTKVLL